MLSYGSIRVQIVVRSKLVVNPTLIRNPTPLLYPTTRIFIFEPHMLHYPARRIHPLLLAPMSLILHISRNIQQITRVLSYVASRQGGCDFWVLIKVLIIVRALEGLVG